MSAPSNKSGSIPSMEASGEALKDETVVIVLGASGDLAKKKTFPALYALFAQGFLPKDVHIVGYARTKMDKDEFHKRQVQYIKGDQEKIKQFQELSSYVSGPYDQDAGYQELLKHVEELEGNRETRNRIFYMALPPSVFTTVAKGLKKNCYSTRGTNRIIIEKPFGKDLESCRQMMSELKSEWAENETYRIDHYLGKEMVKNLLVLRFGNIFLDASFNKNYISNVQITFKEPFGTEGRGGYFDEFGIIRDVCQNHLMQALSILAMERPVSFSAEDIRDEKVKVLRCIPAIDRKDVLFGQYVGAGDKPGYLEDDTVPKDSKCPTFAAMTLWINNPRWEGVPFIMKAGKALNEAKVEIRVQYKDATQGIFMDIPRDELVMRIQPDEAVYLKMNNKLPGFHTRAVPVELDLTYKKRFTDANIPQAYEALILDALKGDHSNFVRDDELDVAWKIFTPILHWIDSKDAPKPEPYPYGSRGPKEIDEFTAKYGFKRSPQTYSWPKTSANL
ncbi:glucose-6-phosphate dehydrogenase [Cryptococcus gattii E566]|uniref:Glucose-6-phosphate 1-dehydrogenase n=2 Tax=Cryptococcus gattii TaxID=37769 RepID=E6R974_CRYGW|nr:Glucose-6-phosphate 1-dehydrogenase, putative [Cryptococcus gattii WM276]ADV23423.1 Glucose-6-phosphate 1-dehydrogenase, putative [Cryptococcus gattii WM276]KIR77946.1 glucose-6-phosphate dehydrogenase [Cryptococcus gattii EJB2]KIY32028.1 glucose-6-phosphate dehydrogenase [Cryptococcus gattii E566]KJE00106.1 glucose-6-phosphate dehydrogenase [Cryptococcus gattii NT-10]